MSEVIQQGVVALNEKLDGEGFDGLAKFVIEEEGTIVLDSDGARAADDDADVTLTASAETFRGMMDGNVNPTMAFMSGQLKIDGDMALAMKLAAVLS
ncbi:SCP2 sterol-binding domain-containing protein [Pararhodobacter sp.]|jgi:putative sterol carrier protein|uniref:SCP2 sterol-binding domain-containing protein n=1 Tax=Pararhodobacter sp. TaxID=2127056 RepID=UPI002FDD6DBD